MSNNPGANTSTTRFTLSQPHPAISRRGFTLIELLVVVSIITLLISILLPALGGARKKSYETTCAVAMRNLMLDMNIYLAEYDQTFPINGIMFPKPGGNNTSPTTGYGNGEIDPQKWDLPYGQLWKYANGQRKKYICPIDDKIRPNAGSLVRDPNTGVIAIQPGTGEGYWSYSVNTILNSEGQFRNNFSPRGGTGLTGQPWIDPLRTLNVLQPAGFATFIEEDNTSRNNDEVFDAPAYNGGDKLAGRHNNGGHVAFLDAHVEWYSEVLFNQVPSATAGGPLDHWNAMSSPFTRMFFPDGGVFATPP